MFKKKEEYETYVKVKQTFPEGSKFEYQGIEFLVTVVNQEFNRVEATYVNNVGELKYVNFGFKIMLTNATPLEPKPESKSFKYTFDSMSVRLDDPFPMEDMRLVFNNGECQCTSFTTFFTGSNIRTWRDVHIHIIVMFPHIKKYGFIHKDELPDRSIRDQWLIPDSMFPYDTDCRSHRHKLMH